MNQLDAFQTAGSSPPRRFRGCYPGEIAPTPTLVPGPDFELSGHGSVYRLLPASPAAERWLGDHLTGEVSYLGRAVAVEHRYVSDIVAGIEGAGLVVS